MEKIMEPFGARLKVLRKAKKLKQSDMALLLDCTDRHYQRMEYGYVTVRYLTISESPRTTFWGGICRSRRGENTYICDCFFGR